MDKVVRIPVHILKEKIKVLFTRAGLNDEDAQSVTEVLMCAELAGISTHGISMVPAHLNKCKNGYNLSARLIVESSTDVFTICNADNAIGMLSAWKCVELAVNNASKSGIHLLLCNHANTFSAAYCYAKYVVERGKIGIISCNAPSQMAPLGGKEKLIGTNPLAIGIPADEEPPFILDMATSVVAKSKINQALHSGEDKIPFGWATDINGIPTDDPKKAMKGLLLPMAGPKGYGLSIAIDIISGVLSHASYLDTVGRFYSDDNSCMNVGQSFLIIDPEIIYGNGFYSTMDGYFKRIRQSVPSDAGTEVFLPGDINMKSMQEKLTNGILLSVKTVGELNQCLLDCGEQGLF